MEPLRFPWRTLGFPEKGAEFIKEELFQNTTGKQGESQIQKA